MKEKKEKQPEITITIPKDWVCSRKGNRVIMKEKPAVRTKRIRKANIRW